MRQKVLSLLVLLTTVVTGAWAAGESKTTYKAPQVIYERGGTTAWSDADLASWTHSQWLTLTKESNGIQAKSKNGSEAAVYSLNLGDGSIVEIEAEFTLWSNTGRYLNANTGSYFRFGSIYIIENDQDQASAYSLDGFTTNTVFTGISGYRPSSIDGAASYYLTMRVNTATNTLESLAVAPSKGADAVLTLTDVALTNPDYSNVAIGYQKNGSMGKDQIELLKSIKITETKVAYTVALADGTMDADNWTIDPNPAAEGDKVTATYTGAKKVIGVKVEKYNPDPKAVPLTFEVLTNGTIKVSFPRNGMKYSLNGGEKTAVPGGSGSDISVKAGDIIEFYGNGSSYYNMGSDHTSIGGTAEVKVYGNIMSLLSETNFATATTLTAEQTFRELFRSYSKLTDASGLLLPAMTLTNNCYYEMFYSCSGMTAAPAELPAETLASSCYYEMFSSCSKLTTAPVLPATSLVSNCYRSMFSYCSKLSSVTCLATSGIDSNNSTYNWMLSAGSQAAGDKTFTADKTAEWPNTGNGIPSGWTRVDYVAPGN